MECPKCTAIVEEGLQSAWPADAHIYRPSLSTKVKKAKIPTHSSPNLYQKNSTKKPGVRPKKPIRGSCLLVDGNWCRSR